MVQNAEFTHPVDVEIHLTGEQVDLRWRVTIKNDTLALITDDLSKWWRKVKK